MAELLAGLVCGYALALAVTPLGALALVRGRASAGANGDALPAEGRSLLMVSLLLHVGGVVVLTMAGLLLGLMFLGIESNNPEGGLGSPNRIFALFVSGIAAIAVLPMAALLPRYRAALLVSGVLFAALFGWAMPWLATLGD